MAVANQDDLTDAFNNPILVQVQKASLASVTAGGFTSLWRATGIPGQGAIPTTVAVCDDSFVGAPTFTNPTSPARTYLLRTYLMCSNSACVAEIHDRLSACGGLSGIVTTAQTCNVDASASGLSARFGAADYSEVRWWLEWYTVTGGTACTATVAVTYNDASTGTVAIAIPATTQAARLFPIISATSGKFIKSVQSVTLSLTTGTAGNFGVTATRLMAPVEMALANFAVPKNYLDVYTRWPDDACLMLVETSSTTTTGTLNGMITLGQK